MLKRRVKQLSEAGIKAEYLSSHDLHLEEPAVEVGEGGGAAFFPDDCQLDAHRTVAFIEKVFSGVFISTYQQKFLFSSLSKGIPIYLLVFVWVICRQINILHLKEDMQNSIMIQ